jgi:hypothetical protein
VGQQGHVEICRYALLLILNRLDIDGAAEAAGLFPDLIS